MNSIKCICCCVLLLNLVACGGEGDVDPGPKKAPSTSAGKDEANAKKAPAKVDPVTLDDLEKAVAAADTELVATELTIQVFVGDDRMAVDATMLLPKGASIKTSSVGVVSIQSGERFDLDVIPHIAGLELQIVGMGDFGFSTETTRDHCVLLRAENNFRFILVHNFGEHQIMINPALFDNNTAVPIYSLNDCALMLKCARTLTLKQ